MFILCCTFFWLVNVCFCCVRFLFSIPGPESGLVWNPRPKITYFLSSKAYKNSSGDEIANVNFYEVRPKGIRIR